ncbi:MAG TPA: TIGR03790 family protein, partial [Bryobacteraceae bacterium]|nr:TIGR03790 family protein [Bryobacteraceae bacterium]
MHNRFWQSFARCFARISGTAPALAMLLVAAHLTNAQSSQLGQNVLVVYNSANSDSIDVANYYVSKRGIPSANLCAITPASTTWLNWSAFDSTVRTPVRQCLNTLGVQNILYIVFTYQTPYKVIAPDNASYALDQFVADIWDVYTPSFQFGMPAYAHPYYVDSQSQGNVYAPFQSFASFRSQSGILIYSVWRLDAATPALAKGLVDQALVAENAGLSGQVCIDEQIQTPTYDNISTSGASDWDLRQAATFARQAGIPVIQDFNSAEFGTSPAPLRCDNASLYSGGYSLNHYNDAFTWNAGAIGFHLDSASGYDPRGGTNWSANALIHGIAVTSGAVSEPYFWGLPHPDGVFRSLFEGANVGDAFMRNTLLLKWTIMNIGDPLYRPFPAGFPAVTAPQNSLALNPRYLIGGNPSTGTITLAAPAPAGGVTVALQSNRTTTATVQPSITIAAGQTTASFPINTNIVTIDSPLYITGTFGTSTLTNTLVPQALLARVALSPTSIIGGNSGTGSVYLNANAPSGGIVVGLSSNNSAVSVPASVAISAGVSSATFPISSTAVSAAISVTISASYAGANRTSTLTVNPLIPVSVTLSPTSVIGGVSTTANKVTLNGPAPADAAVNLSSSDPGVTVPASVTVAAGTSVSPVFTITTSSVSATTPVTISATYNGVTKTSNLTINPIAVSVLTLSPTSVVGGASTTVNKVTLNSAAPAGGA